MGLRDKFASCQLCYYIICGTNNAPPFFTLKEELILVIISLSTLGEKSHPNFFSWKQQTDHTPRGQPGFPAATQGLRTWEWNPALPHFPGHGTGKEALMSHLGYVRERGWAQSSQGEEIFYQPR